MIKSATEYLASRINRTDTQTASGEGSTSLQIVQHQDDFDAGVVALNDGARRSLPIVAFPAITAKASSAGAFGGYGFLQSVGLAFGRNESVSLDFGDSRVFGPPDRGLTVPEDKLEDEFTANACSKLATLYMPHETGNPDRPIARNVDKYCPEGNMCGVHLVVRTYETRRIGFTYSSSRITRFALNQRKGELPDTPTTLGLPGNLDVQIEVGPDTKPETVAKLMSELSKQINETRINDAETNGLSFVGFQGTSMKFERIFRKPVAFAYESMFWGARSTAEDLCGVPQVSVQKNN